MILGIGTSGRHETRDESGRLMKGVNEHMLKYVSLAGKKINLHYKNKHYRVIILKKIQFQNFIW